MPSAIPQPTNVIDTFVDYYVPPEIRPGGELDFEEQFGNKSVVHHPIVLKDMRAGSFTIENNGFQLVPLHSKMSVSDYSNIETIEKRYFPEVRNAVKKFTGASRTFVVLPKVRNTDLQKKGFERGWNVNAGPIRRSHIDLSGDGKEEAMTKVFGADFMATIEGRWKLFNAWKPIKLVERDPLAVIDRVPEEDLLPLHRSVEGKTVKEGRYLIKAGMQDHDWYFAPEQRPAHASVALPGTDEKPARESVEVRVLAVWD